MFAGVIKVDDVDSAGEVGLDDVLYPFGAVGENDDALGLKEPAADRLGVDAPSELVCDLDGRGGAGRVG